MLLIDFCRSSECSIRKIIDNQNNTDTEDEVEKGCREAFLKGAACKECMAWKFQRFMEENLRDERCVGRS